MSLKNSETGFTLIEILVAIFIFSIVMATIFGSFHSVFSNTQALDEDTTLFEMTKNSMDRMTFDLQSIYVSTSPEYRRPDMDDSPDPYRIIGETVAVDNTGFPMLRFTGLTHISLENSRQDGIAEIVYYVQKRNDGNFVLRRSDQLYPYKPFIAKESDPILCNHVKALTFVYYDQDGTEHEHWNSDSEDFKFSTPQAVGINIQAGDDKHNIALETTVSLPVFRKIME